MSMSKKCPKCSKTIYPNDPKLSMGDHTYHKSCSKCETCNGQLNIKNFATSGDRLLCKTHFMEEFAQSGGKYGGGEKFKQQSAAYDPTQTVAGAAATTKAAPATTAAAPKAAAEPKAPAAKTNKLSSFLNKSPTETSTATTTEETKPLCGKSDAKPLGGKSDATTDATAKEEPKEEEAKPAAKKVATKKFNFGGGAAAKSNKCPKCSKTIYPNDPKLSMGDHTYHKSCSKCETCNSQLTIKNFATSGDRLLCKTHFMEEFAQSGGKYGGGEKFKQQSTAYDPTQTVAGAAATTNAAPAVTAAAAAAPTATAAAAPTATAAAAAAPAAAPATVSDPKVEPAPEEAPKEEPKKEEPKKEEPTATAEESKVEAQKEEPKEKATPPVVKKSSNPKKKFSFGVNASTAKKCPKCSKTIYPNDPKLSMGDHTYHKSCSKCETCNGQLNIKNFATSGDRLLCKTHFMEEFHSSGGTYGGDDKFSHASRGHKAKE